MLKNLAGTKDELSGGRILFEFKVQPKGVEAVGAVFDVTRQIQFRDYLIVNGQGPPPPKDKKDFPTLIGKKDFPWLQTPVKDNETDNDDSNADDEQNAPNMGLLYVFDTPGVALDNTTEAFIVSRNTFFEWVRMKVNGEAFAEAQDSPQGSRVSSKYAWHSVSYLKRGPNDRLVEDNDNISASEPKLTGAGNGTATVVLQAGAVSEGFTATYEIATGKWTLKGTSGDTISAMQPKVPAGTTWTLTIDKKITVTIIQGATFFADKAHFDFSVFETSDAKVNKTAEGEFDVLKGP